MSTNTECNIPGGKTVPSKNLPLAVEMNPLSNRQGAPSDQGIDLEKGEGKKIVPTEPVQRERVGQSSQPPPQTVQSPGQSSQPPPQTSQSQGQSTRPPPGTVQSPGQPSQQPPQPSQPTLEQANEENAEMAAALAEPFSWRFYVNTFLEFMSLCFIQYMSCRLSGAAKTEMSSDIGSFVEALGGA